jgi:hypothetical protein
MTREEGNVDASDERGIQICAWMPNGEGLVDMASVSEYRRE